MIKQAFVLAGGKGERLGCTDIPKPMYPIGGVPILGLMLDRVVDAGVDDLVVAVPPESAENNWKGQICDCVIQYRGPIKKVRFIDSKPDLERTILSSSHFLLGNFYLLCADIYSDVTLANMGDIHEQNMAVFTATVVDQKDSSEYGVFRYGVGGQISFDPSKQNTGPGLVDTGLWAATPEFVAMLKKVGFGRAVEMVYERRRGYIYEHSGGWTDIGRPEKYDAACSLPTGKKP